MIINKIDQSLRRGGLEGRNSALKKRERILGPDSKRKEHSQDLISIWCPKQPFFWHTTLDKNTLNIEDLRFKRYVDFITILIEVSGFAEWWKFLKNSEFISFWWHTKLIFLRRHDIKILRKFVIPLRSLCLVTKIGSVIKVPNILTYYTQIKFCVFAQNEVIEILWKFVIPFRKLAAFVLWPKLVLFGTYFDIHLAFKGM